MIFFSAVQILNFLQLSSPCEISLVYLIYIDCTSILDSLVVRISACHVEGPGSIPGRGVQLFQFISSIYFYNFVNKHNHYRARVAQSVER